MTKKVKPCILCLLIMATLGLAWCVGMGVAITILLKRGLTALGWL